MPIALSETRPHILFVDADKKNHDKYRRWYETEYPSLVSIHTMDGYHGLKIAIEKQPRLIVTSLALPIIWGEDLVRILREDRRTAFIPILIYTGYFINGFEVDSVLADVVIKTPVELETFFEECLRLIGRVLN